ncbi:MAG: type IA DNA topoisomerase [Ruminococcaceae bacterium]|nr:type IA DNA topoisomerase [Oscillospiraceae bacterium]
MYRLIISEKPSVSASIAYCIGATEKVSHGDNFYWRGNGYIVTNAIGHLLGIGMPADYGYEKWELATLPLIPKNFRLFPLKGYGDQIKMLGELINRDDVSEVINACDAGREGECIFRYIYNYFGCTKPVKRLWISSLTDESIKHGMENLIEGYEKNSLYEAGFTRARADWILGMSLSRLYSILNDDNHKVGRVKTPVLNIIAERDNSIAAFVKKPYFKVILGNGAECENTFNTAERAEEICGKCDGKTVTVTAANAENKTENRPLLHSLTSLQREANDVYGMTAADTLKAAQSLYEKKLITYPRTDSNFLSDDMKTIVESIVKCLSGYDEKRVNVLLENGLNIDKRVIDNSKVSDHHAIIPTNIIGKMPEMMLSENEKNVAELVINRFLCALDKPYGYTETKYEFSVEGEVFKLTVKRAEEWGWKWYRKVTDSDDEDVQPNITYSENETFLAENITVKPCETQPPKHFTESSLLAVMENIDRLISDKDLKGYVKERGLGTPATRANIIEELIAAGYVQRKKKQLVSTEYGRAFAASLPENVKSAELTAHWEQSLSDIENGIGSAADLLAEIEKTVNSIITIERGRENRVRVTRKQSLGNCPRCGQPVVENSKGFSCSAGREKCGFFIWGQDKRIGRKYTAAEISELLASSRVTLKNCTSSKGNKYSAVFELDDTGKYVNLNLVEFIGGKKNGK